MSRGVHQRLLRASLVDPRARDGLNEEVLTPIAFLSPPSDLLCSSTGLGEHWDDATLGVGNHAAGNVPETRSAVVGQCLTAVLPLSIGKVLATLNQEIDCWSKRGAEECTVYAEEPELEILVQLLRTLEAWKYDAGGEGAQLQYWRPDAAGMPASRREPGWWVC